MRRLATLATACALLALAVLPATAQTVPVAAQRQAVATVASVGQIVWTDPPSLNQGMLFVFGWGFEYSSGSGGTIEVHIDGNYIMLPGPFGSWRSPRFDVREVYGKAGLDMLQIPLYSGFNALIDLKTYNVGPGPHTVELYMRNDAGLVTRSYRAQPFIVP